MLENRRITISIWLNPEMVYHPVIVVKDYDMISCDLATKEKLVEQVRTKN